VNLAQDGVSGSLGAKCELKYELLIKREDNLKINELTSYPSKDRLEPA